MAWSNVAQPEALDRRIKHSDRVFLVGSTGSGKTTLAKAMLWRYPRVFVLDPKHTFALPDEWEHSYYQNMAQLGRHPADTKDQPHAAIYRPTLDEMEGGCRAFFEHIFDMGNCYVFVDEVMRVTNGSRLDRGYATVLQLGREKNIGCWSATQRPANIPLAVVTEAEHFFVFRLRSPDDRKRMFDYTGQPELLNAPRDPNGFHYYNDKTGRVSYWRQANVGRILGK